MIVSLVKSLSYSSTIILLFYASFNNFELTDIKLLLVFSFFISVFEIFVLPILKTLLYPLNFLFFGQVRRILVVIFFIVLINFIQFASISSFYFEGTNIAGIIIPEISLSKSIFIIALALLFDFIKGVVFKERVFKK